MNQDFAEVHFETLALLAGSGRQADAGHPVLEAARGQVSSRVSWSATWWMTSAPVAATATTTATSTRAA